MNYYRTFTRNVLGFLAVVFLVSCSRAVGTLDMMKGESQIYVSVRKNEKLEIWNSVDAKFQNKLNLSYQVRIKGNENVLFEKQIDGLHPDIQVASKETAFFGNSSISWSEGRILSGITVLKDMVIQIVASANVDGDQLKLKRNNLIIKVGK